MLPSTHRLRRSRDFSDAVRAGRRARRGTLVVYLRTRSVQEGHAASPRAGFIVPRAVGTAVVRNRVTRRLRHLIAGHLSQLPDGSTVVVRALPTAAGASYHRLAEDLSRALAATERNGARS